MRVRKLPVEVEARPLTLDNAEELAAWCGGTVERGEPIRDCPTVVVLIDGAWAAQEGDWVIRDEAGRFSPCKPEVFAATYEPIALDGDEP